jgi:hypothetical protein
MHTLSLSLMYVCICMLCVCVCVCDMCVCVGVYIYIYIYAYIHTYMILGRCFSGARHTQSVVDGHHSDLLSRTSVERPLKVRGGGLYSRYTHGWVEDGDDWDLLGRRTSFSLESHRGEVRGVGGPLQPLHTRMNGRLSVLRHCGEVYIILFIW